MKKDVPVGTMCAMFGLNPNTVRTWERRYGFPSPGRSEGGHRVYNAADIARITEIMRQVHRGVPVGKAVESARAMAPYMTPAARPHEPQVHDVAPALAQAVELQDQQRLRESIELAVTELGYDRFIEQVAFPLLKQLGQKWESTGVGIAAEHSFTTVISGIILHQAFRLRPAEDAPALVFACAPGELHQLPLLHLANRVMATGLGRAVTLGAGLPIEEIILAAQNAGAELIILSATLAVAPGDVRDWLRLCIEKGWADRVVLAGPGFSRSRVFAELPIKAAVGDFSQVVESLKLTLANRKAAKAAGD